MKIRLETNTGEHVADDHILPQAQDLPRVILWGERVFAWFNDGTPDHHAARFWETPLHNFETVPVYREVFFFAIPKPEMFKEAAQALLAGGKLPEDLH